ncbi:MAG: MmgE/PrpD family protein [Terriglobia bacterium]
MQNQQGVDTLMKKSARVTRRSMFQRAGLAIAFPALSSGAAMAGQAWGAAKVGSAASPVAAGQGISAVMKKLSAYMSDAGSRALPEEVVEKAKEHILDTLAAMVSGSELLPGRRAIEFVRAYGGRKVATVVGSNVVCGPIEAALANGMLAHSDETDDEAPLGVHSGCAVVPAVLATGERFGVGGTRFIRAVTLGYDLPPRIILALAGRDVMSPTHKGRVYRPLAAGFGSAAAAGCAANLGAQQMRWLLDYTAQQAASLPAWRRDTQHIEKAFVFGGMNARSAVASALLVHSGWTGIEDIFSGPDNFFEATSPKADPAELIDELGSRYEVARTNIKKWPVGSPLEAPLDALQILQKRHPFNADQVRRVTVRIATRQSAMVSNRLMPDICLQHIVAVMLLNKTVTFHSANDEALMKDPAVLRQRAKVELIPDEALQRLMPQREAIVQVTLTDGTNLTERVAAYRGTVKNPMSRAEIITKARDLMASVLGPAKCNSLIEKIFALENVKDIRELRPLLQRP